MVLLPIWGLNCTTYFREKLLKVSKFNICKLLRLSDIYSENFYMGKVKYYILYVHVGCRLPICRLPVARCHAGTIYLQSLNQYNT